MNDEAMVEKYFGLIQKQLTSIQENMVTKAELAAFAFATKADLAGLATKDELRQSVAGLATKVDLGMLRAEMRERFQSVDEQFRTLTLKTELFETRVEGKLSTMSAELKTVNSQLSGIKDQSTQLDGRMDRLEVGLGNLSGRVDSLADDMRQRFKVVNERLTTVA